MAHGGEALGRADGRVVFVPFGLPGEVVEVALVDERPDYARGVILSVIRPSPSRVEPRCALFGECGGCQWQHAEYATQLEMKRGIVAEQLRRIGGFADAEELVLPTIGMVDPWAYRNHIRFSVGRQFGDLGFTKKQTRKLLRVDRCWIADRQIDEIRDRIQGRLAGQRVHQVAVRVGCTTGEVMVSPALPTIDDVTSGQTELHEELLGRRFRIAGPSFFQVNTRREPRHMPAGTERFAELVSPGGISMAEILMLVALAGLGLQPDDLVVDAYCGVGTFTAAMAPYVRAAVGIEESTAAVADADRNCADLPNVSFMAGKVETVLAEMGTSERLPGAPTKILLDPARVGCDPRALTAMAAARPDRIVYVSCEPATLARDLALLRDAGYRLESVQPVDMFPQTYHVESVSVLRHSVPG